MLPTPNRKLFPGCLQPLADQVLFPLHLDVNGTDLGLKFFGDAPSFTDRVALKEFTVPNSSLPLCLSPLGLSCHQPPNPPSLGVELRDHKHCRVPIMFWDTFESAIHNNPTLTSINYLNSLLESVAPEAISGLTLTSANYEEAIAIDSGEGLAINNSF